MSKYASLDARTELEQIIAEDFKQNLMPQFVCSFPGTKHRANCIFVQRSDINV